MKAIFVRVHHALGLVMGPLCRVSLAIATISMIGLALLVLFQVISRYLNIGVVWASDLAGYALVGTTFLAMAPTLRNAIHVRVSVIVANISERARPAVELWCYSFGLLLAIYATRWTVVQVLESHRFGDVSIGMVAFKLWVPQIPIAVGFAILALTFLEGVIAILAGKPTPEALADASSKSSYD